MFGEVCGTCLEGLFGDVVRCLDIFKGLGCTTSGVESSQELVSICQKKGHEVACGFLGDRDTHLYSKKKEYDCAVSFNFIEHLPNPKAVLINLSNLLASDAVGLFEVPNFDLIERNKLFNEFIIILYSRCHLSLL